MDTFTVGIACALRRGQLTFLLYMNTKVQGKRHG